MALRGQVMNGVVVFESDPVPPDGTVVEVIPLKNAAAAASAVAGPPYPVSEEQRKALLRLIGMWKVPNPPGDEEVERIIEEERMRKHG